jgi:site-specific DNA-methyltransferase (adenine-specific)
MSEIIVTDDVERADKSVVDCVFAFPNKSNAEEILSTILSESSIMKPDVSLWFWNRSQHIGGSISEIPWKVVMGLKDNGWAVKNEISWSCKVSDPAPENRLKRGHENLYHLTKGKNYFYDRTMGIANSARNLVKNKDGVVTTRSGVIGLKYERQISSSPFLSEIEKANAMAALQKVVESMAKGEISDFRMIIRGIQKVSKSVSSRIDRDGFYVRTTLAHSMPLEDCWTSFKFDPNTSIPTKMISSILKLSCPPGGTVLDFYPSPVVAKAVIASGRNYIANSICMTITEDEESQLFKTEEVQNEVSKPE